MLEKRYIYGLYDVSDETKTICYVGQAKYMKGRLAAHKKAYIKILEKEKTLSKVNEWIRNVYDSNSEIDMVLIQKCNIKNVDQREIFWIKKYRKTNILYNTMAGGKGLSKYDITYKQFEKWVEENIPHITSERQWEKIAKTLPLFIPRSPRDVFMGNGWVSWGKLFRTGRKQDNLIAKKYVLYNDAKKWIEKKLDIKTREDWKKLVKKGKIPNTIPNRPDRFYNKDGRGWISWGDFLGTGRVANQNLIRISFIEAKTCVQKLNINSIRDYKKNYSEGKIRKDIPKDPRKYYKNKGWISWGDFLGHGREQDNLLAEKYYIYEKAKKWAQKNVPEITTREQWNKEYAKKGKIPYFIPNNPENFYSKKNRGWKGWGDFLKNGNVSNFNKIYIPYNEAKIIICKKKFRTIKEWNVFKQSKNFPKNIPKQPKKIYKDWISWEDFLGENYTGKKESVKFYAIDELKELLIKNDIKNWLLYIKFKKETKNNKIPSNPKKIYKNWKGCSMFFKYKNLIS